MSSQRVRGQTRTHTPPGLIIKEHYWRWPEQDKAGNTIAFFVQILGLSFHEATRQITAASA